MQNEDLNALNITGTMNHIITISVTQCQSKWHYNYYSVQNRVYHRACRCNTDNNDTLDWLALHLKFGSVYF